jgi:hypothetical protein
MMDGGGRGRLLEGVCGGARRGWLEGARGAAAGGARRAPRTVVFDRVWLFFGWGKFARRERAGARAGARGGRSVSVAEDLGL